MGSLPKSSELRQAASGSKPYHLFRHDFGALTAPERDRLL
jgi:hypothetical protein